MLVEYTFLIPVVRDTSKQQHPDNTWNWLNGQLTYNFHGYTVGGSVFGSWTDDNGNEITEESKLYRVAIPESRESTLRDILSRCKIHFDQQTIYLARTATYAALV